MSSPDDDPGSQPAQGPDASDSPEFKFSAIFLGGLLALIVFIFVFRCTIAQCTKYFGTHGRLRGRRRRAREARLNAEAQQVIRRYVAGMAEEDEDYMTLNVRVNGTYNLLEIRRSVVDRDAGGSSSNNDDDNTNNNHLNDSSDDGGHGLQEQQREERGRARTRQPLDCVHGQPAAGPSIVEPRLSSGSIISPPAIEQQTLDFPLRRSGRARRTPEEAAAQEAQFERDHEQNMLNPSWLFV